MNSGCDCLQQKRKKTAKESRWLESIKQLIERTLKIHPDKTPKIATSLLGAQEHKEETNSRVLDGGRARDELGAGMDFLNSLSLDWEIQCFCIISIIRNLF